MSTLQVNKIQPTTESGVLDITGFRFLNLLLGDVRYRSDWLEQTTYLVKDVVIFDNKIYRCNESHDSLNSFDYSKWELIDVTISVNGVTPGEYLKVTVDALGRVISGSSLTADDIPAIDASKISTGFIPLNRLGSGVVDSSKYLRGDGSWTVPRVVKVRETVVTSENQTVVVLPTMTYSVGAGTLDVYLNGLLQILGEAYTETTNNSITFSEGLTAGMKVMFVETRIV